MPNGIEEFEKKRAEWQEKTQLFQEKSEASQARLASYTKQLEQAAPEQMRAQLAEAAPTPLKQLLQLPRWLIAPAIGPQLSSAVIAEIKKEASVTMAELEKSDFYTRLYGEVPYVISAGKVTSADEVLSMLRPPDTLTATELEEVKDTIRSMVSTIIEPSELVLPGEMEYPELVAPTPVSRVPVTIHQLSVEDIIKSLKTPRAPEGALTQAEYEEFLRSKGWDDEDIDQEQQILAEQIIAIWEDSTNQTAANKAAIAEMPDYELTDMLKQMAIQPGLAAMEMVGAYRERVSMPLAGHLWKNIYPDIEAEYQRYKLANPDVGDWVAMGHAFEDWDAPYEGTAEWMYKYILLEGIADPLSYAGWGIATKITRPFGRFGRAVGGFERGALSVLNLPFDFVKHVWGKLPKTLTQRALLVRSKSEQYVESYITKVTGKSMSPGGGMNMPELQKAAEKAMKFAFENPHAESDMALAGRAMLMHAPVDEAATKGLAISLKSTLRPDDITVATVQAVDDVFEDFFWKTSNKLLTVDEAAGRLLSIFHNAGDDTLRPVAKRWLEERSLRILRGATDFARAENPTRALMLLGFRNYKTHIFTEEAAATLARRYSGAYSTNLHRLDLKLQAIWRNGIDRWIVRPFAEAYLTFGMYGPMNMLEDYVRSTLGGVFPRRMTNKRFGEVAIGLRYDPNLRRDAISEMLGYFRARPEGELNNWILQLGGLAKGFGDKTYQVLVTAPGHIGMEVRRNFLAGRYFQILADMGGDSFKALTAAGPRRVPPEILEKGLRREMQLVANDLKTTGSPDAIRAGKDLFTRKKIIRNEVDTILKEHPNLPRPVRDYVMKAYDDDTLLRTADDIERVIRVEANDIMMDDFLRGPEIATQQYKQLTDFLVALEVKSPREMASAIQAVHKMSEIYGALPDQIIARATVKSRGLPLVERRASIDTEFDRIYQFLDAAGADIGRVIKRLDAIDIGTVGYQKVRTRVLSIMTTKQEYALEFRTQNMATRHEIFAGVSKKEMTGEFWDDFYLRMNNEFRQFSIRQADLDGQLVRAMEQMNVAAGAKLTARPPIIVRDRPLAPQDIATLLGVRGDDISRALLDVLTVQNNKEFFVAYVRGMTRAGDVGFTKKAIGDVYDQIAYSLRVAPESMSWITGKQMELEAVRREMHSLYNSKMLPDTEIAAVGKYFDDIAKAVDDLMYTTKPPIKGKPPVKTVKPEYTDYDDMRQKAMDEAHKWYYQEYPDYTNANAFDSMMKTIYPYWTYESQRWFWLPRSFVRHPGTFTAFERWQDNTDYGYIHIPNTDVDVNPFRGTIYGSMTTRLTRRDFPEYYDSLGAAGGLIEFNDYLTRFGFYPGAHLSIPLAMMGGAEQQMGETIPAIWKSPLNALIALFPESENVKWLSEHIFSDRFRSYVTILEANKRGYNGSHLWVKIKENIPLTDEEQAVWDESRGEAAFWGMGFEHGGMYRLRTDEQYEAYEKAAAVIEEMTGYTPEQQRRLRMHGYRIWDMVGGLSPTNQAILQEMETYKWLGTITPLLPSRQQMEIRKLDLDWDDVMTYTENNQSKKLQLQQDFLSGKLGPREYNDRLQALYSEQRTYIDGKVEENPNMTLEGRKEYYKRYGIAAPVQHPMKELLNLYFSIELNTEAIDDETGEKYTDWDTFFAQRMAIDDAIPEELKEEWEAYLSRNTTRIEEIRRDVSSKYFRKYYDIWEATLATYPDNEQRLVNEYLYLERTGQNLTRQVEIREIISTKTSNQLISSFRSDVSDSRAALRYANPHLDAWLFYWGRTTSFKTPQAEAIYKQIAVDTGRQI